MNLVVRISLQMWFYIYFPSFQITDYFSYNWRIFLHLIHSSPCTHFSSSNCMHCYQTRMILWNSNWRTWHLSFHGQLVELRKLWVNMSVLSRLPRRALQSVWNQLHLWLRIKTFPRQKLDLPLECLHFFGFILQSEGMHFIIGLIYIPLFTLHFTFSCLVPYVSDLCPVTWWSLLSFLLDLAWGHRLHFVSQFQPPCFPYQVLSMSIGSTGDGRYMNKMNLSCWTNGPLRVKR